MTILQVHLIMLGLGVIAYLFLAGLFSNRKSHSKRLRRQWWMGAIAAIAVIASPLTRFWREPASGIDLLTQSLMVSAIILLALLLFALLSYPFRKLFGGRRKTEAHTDSGFIQPVQHSPALAKNDSTPIVIDANQTNASHVEHKHETVRPASAEVTIDRSMPNANNDTAATNHHEDAVKANNKQDVASGHNETIQAFADADRAPDIHLNPDDIDDLRTSKPMHNAINAEETELEIELLDDNSRDTVKVADETHISLHEDQFNTRELNPTEIESVVPMQSKHDATQRLDEKFSRSIAANDNSKGGLDTLRKSDESTLQISDAAIPAQEDKLDLSESEQLFAEIRQQSNELQLPPEEELRQAKANSAIDELDLDTQLIQDDKQRADAKSASIETDSIEEAEVVELDSEALHFGNDLTGEYAHPSASASDIGSTQTTARAASIGNQTQQAVVPETLDDAIIAAKASAVSLQAQVSDLENSITELDDLRDATMDATIDAAQVTAEHNHMLIKQKDTLLKSEDAARKAAESVIAAQSALIDRARRQQALVNRMLDDERKRLGQLKQEVVRSRKMARSAAHLARRAAIAQQQSRDVAKREQMARLKSQESTRKAVTIARNAISALAAEERKRGITRH